MKGCLWSERTETFIVGGLIVLYTMISTSTANVAVMCLPFFNSEFINFPNLSLVSGLMSAAKITSSFLIFIFPSSNYEIMIILGTKAVLMAALSELYPMFDPLFQGTWVSICIVLLTFSCGSTVARALTITKNEDDTKFLSNCFTVGKSSVHAVELLATTVFYTYYQWEGLVVWICCAYAFVTISTLLMYIFTSIKKRKSKNCENPPLEKSHHSQHEPVDHLIEEDVTFLLPSDAGENNRTGRKRNESQTSKVSVLGQSVEERFAQYEDENEWKHGENERSTLVESILESISVRPQNQPPISSSSYFQLLVKDVSQASLGAWMYLFFSEAAGMSLSVIILCGTRYLKEIWNFSPSDAALTIVLPQLMVIPAFCLLSLVKIDNFLSVIVGNAGVAIIAMLPFIPNRYGWSICVFTCELFNAARVSSQMPGFNLLVDSPRIARRFISISTVFVFILRTIGLSGGTALYDVDPQLPFIICGVCQIVASLILCFLLWKQIPYIQSMRRKREFQANLEASLAQEADLPSYGATSSDRTSGSSNSRNNEHTNYEARSNE